MAKKQVINATPNVATEFTKLFGPPPLFNLLVPLEIEPYLAGTSEMVLEVDRSTAAIPWELLKPNPDARLADTRPWAVRIGMFCRLGSLEESRPVAAPA